MASLRKVESEGTMTKYRLDRDPDTGKPCMVADPDGIYYSVGEADREIAERDDLIRRMAGMMNRARPEREKPTEPA